MCHYPVVESTFRFIFSKITRFPLVCTKCQFFITKKHGVLAVLQAETIHKHLFSALEDYDVFMSVSTLGGAREPAAGDLSACDPLRPRKQGARLFCEVVAERPRPMCAENRVWETFYYPDRRLQQGLQQQLYGMYRCVCYTPANTHTHTHTHILF